MEQIRIGMKDKIKELILKLVKLQNGISDVGIIMMIMSEIGPAMFQLDEYHEAYEELLRDEEIIVIEFFVPAARFPSRAKTLLFVKGTIFSNLLEISNEQKRTQQIVQTNMDRQSDTHIQLPL